MAQHRIVIVGGGIAGIEIATRLGTTLGRDGRAAVTLVDRGLSHVWKPMLHTFAAGTARPDRQKVDFLDQAKRCHFRFWPGELQGVDRVAKRIAITPFAGVEEPGVGTDTLGYDTLILSLGSRANDFGTPGVAEHCSTIDSLMEAVAFHARLRRHVVSALRTAGTLDIAIVGGGATGVELAAELKRAVDLLASYGSPGLPGRLRLALVEAGPRLLAAFPESVSEAATRTLIDLGVDVRTGTQVSGADEHGFSLRDGSRIEAAIKVWAAGVRAPAVLADIEGLERSRTGQLVVWDTLQTSADEAIFALGDCASLVEAATGKPVPATAQAARQQAQHLASHLAAWLDGAAMAPFRYREKGAIVSLADFNGWGTLGSYTFGGGRLRGLSARLAHDLLYRQHQIELFGLLKGAVAWLADDLDRLVSPPVRLD